MPLSVSVVSIRKIVYISMIILHLDKPNLLHRFEPWFSVLHNVLPLVGALFNNVDASLCASRTMGIGVVIRNHLGLVLAASRWFIHHVDNPELGEAIAMRHALIFAEDSGFQKILVETDCASLINKIKSKVDDRSHTGAVVFNIKSRAPRFLSCCFTHVSRRCNEAAHVLGKSAEHDDGSC